MGTSSGEIILNSSNTNYHRLNENNKPSNAKTSTVRNSEDRFEYSEDNQCKHCRNDFFSVLDSIVGSVFNFVADLFEGFFSLFIPKNEDDGSQENNISINRTSKNVLPLSKSGTFKYPENHSVFTNNTQGSVSESEHPPDYVVASEENSYDYLNRRSNYEEDVYYGSLYFRKFSQRIKDCQGKKSIELCLAETTQNGIDIKHNPLYRIGNNSSIDNPNSDFEVLVITGSEIKDCGAPGFKDDNRFKFDAFMLKHAVQNNYQNHCKEFTIVNDPSNFEIEQAIKEKSESCRKNGRKLYIVYRGHGDYDGTQDGINYSNSYKEGSKSYIFCTKEKLREEHYKSILQKYLNDIETINIIGSCYSGAAITAIDPGHKKQLTRIA